MTRTTWMIPTSTSEGHPTRACTVSIMMETSLSTHNLLGFLDQERVSNSPEVTDQ